MKKGSSRRKQSREAKGSKKMASDKSSAVTSSSSQGAASQSSKVRQRQKQQRQDDPLDDPSTLQSQLSPDMVARPFSLPHHFVYRDDSLVYNFWKAATRSGSIQATQKWSRCLSKDSVERYIETPSCYRARRIDLLVLSDPLHLDLAPSSSRVPLF